MGCGRGGGVIGTVIALLIAASDSRPIATPPDTALPDTIVAFAYPWDGRYTTSEERERLRHPQIIDATYLMREDFYRVYDADVRFRNSFPGWFREVLERLRRGVHGERFRSIRAGRQTGDLVGLGVESLHYDFDGNHVYSVLFRNESVARELRRVGRQ